jgi:hypothetical protein
MSSADEESWLSHSPTKCERVWTNVLLAILLVIVPAAVSLTAFNSMFDFVPKLIFSHLSSTLNLVIGILAGTLALGFAVIDLLRIFCNNDYQDKLFKNSLSEECGPCKAFLFRVIGAHEDEEDIFYEHLGDHAGAPFVAERSD